MARPEASDLQEQDQTLNEAHLHIPSGKIVVWGNLALMLSFSRPDIPFPRQKIIVLDPANKSIPEIKEDIMPLGQVHRGKMDGLSNETYEFEDLSELTNEQILERARWISTKLPEPENPKEMFFNERVVEIASFLRLLPTVSQITYPTRFRSSSNFYRELGVKRTWRRFHEMTRDDAVTYIANLTFKNGRMPTEDELMEMASDDPTLPSYGVLINRLPEGFSSVGREIGLVKVRETDGQGFLDWATEFYIANYGLRSTGALLSLYSPLGRSPSRHPTQRRYKSVEDMHIGAEKQLQNDLLKLCRILNSGKLPRELFVGAVSGFDLLSRVVRYGIVSNLLPDLFEGAKLDLALIEKEAEFLNNLKKYSDNIYFPQVEAASSEFGVLKNIWRTEFLRSLSLPEVIEAKLKTIRGPLEYIDRQRMDAVVENCLELLDTRGFYLLRSNHLRILRESGKIPDSDELKRLFVDIEYLRLLIRFKQSQRAKQGVASDASKNLPTTIEQGELTPETVITSFWMEYKGAEVKQLAYEIAPGLSEVIDDMPQFSTVEAQTKTDASKYKKLVGEVIQKEINSGAFPSEVLSGASSSAEIIRRYIRYKIASKFINDLERIRKIIIAPETSKNFVKELQKAEQTIDIKMIEQVVEYLSQII